MGGERFGHLVYVDIDGDKRGRCGISAQLRRRERGRLRSFGGRI